MQSSKEILMSTTAHGIPNLIRTKHVFIKLIWLLSILMALIGLTFFVTKTLKGGVFGL